MSVRTPDVVIVGAQKAATTGLLHTLAMHPAVVVPRVQEVTTLHAGAAGWAPWVRRYEPHLQEARPDEVVVVKLATAMHFADTLDTIRELNPAARAIAVLRHPVNRILSLHRYATQLGFESRPAEMAIRDDAVQRAPQWRLNTYSGGSRYAEAISLLKTAFPDDAVLFLDYADVADPTCLHRVQEFLCLRPVDLESIRANESGSPRSGTVARAISSGAARAIGRVTVPARWREPVRKIAHSLNTSSAAGGLHEVISPQLRAELLQRHAPDVHAAEQALGKALPEWQK